MLAQVTYETSSSAGVGAILIIEFILGIAWIAFQIWVITKILSYSEAQYTAAGQSRSLWMALGILGICCFGVIVDLIWFIAIKPKLDEAPA